MFFLHRIQSEKQIYRFAHYGKCVHIFHLFSRTFRFWAKSKMIKCCHDFFFLHSAYVTNNFLCGEIVKTLFFHNCIFFSSHQKDIFISIFWTYIIFLTIKNVLFGSTDKVSATSESSSNNLSSIKFDLRFLLLITRYEKKNKYTGFFLNY